MDSFTNDNNKKETTSEKYGAFPVTTSSRLKNGRCETILS